MKDPEVMILPDRINVTTTEMLGFGAGKIHSSIETQEQANEIAELLPEFLVAVDPSLPTTCIDGRPVKTLLNGETSQPRYGVAGGAGITGFAAAELTNWFEDSTDSLPERYGRVTGVLETTHPGQLEIVVGGHVDQNGVDSEFVDGTGCGAADKLKIIMDVLVENPRFCLSVTEVILGDAYNVQIAENILSNATQLSAVNHFGSWDGKTMVNDLGNQAGEKLEILESDDSETHFHNEDGLIVNYRENVTFDRDEFYLTTGKQMFDVDVPMVDRIARKLATGPNAQSQAEELLHAAVMYHTATYAALCDGSQRAYAIQ